MEEQRKKSIEELNLECEILEQHLKWQGVPLFVYISALAALAWAVVQQEHLSLHDYGLIIISATLATKIVWTIVMGELFGYKRPDVTHIKFLNVFAENIKIDCGVDILINGLCLCLFSLLELSGSGYLKFYFVFILLFEVAIYLGSRFTAFKLVEEQMVKAKSFPNIFYLIINLVLFSTSVGLIYFQADSIYGMASSMEGNFLNAFKVGVLIGGMILLTKYYIRGTYFFTALHLKKNEKLEFVRSLN